MDLDFFVLVIIPNFLPVAFGVAWLLLDLRDIRKGKP